MEIDFSRVIDLLPGLVWTALTDGRADFVNQRWCEYTGLSFDEACGEGWQSAVHPDDRAPLVEGWLSFTDAGEPGELEARLCRFDGEYRWFLFRFSPLADPSGAIVKWCGVNTDIEDRKRAEEAVRLYERRAQMIVDGLPAIVTLMTPDGELENANRHMLDYFGETLDVLKSRPVGHSFHPDDREDVLARWRRSVETGEPYDHEARLRRADGAYRWFHTLGFPLRGADGQIVVWYLLKTDIDDSRWAETLLAGEKRLLQMVAQGWALSDVLETLCRTVEDAAPGCLCSVLSIDPDGVRFRHGAGPSLPAAYNEALDGLVMDRNYGPCGMAANLKVQVIAADVASDPRWQASSWPSLVLGHGLRSCWSTPILSRDDKVIGVFALYQRESSSPDLREQGLIRQFTEIASIAIERAQSDAALLRNEAFLAEGQRLSLTGSFLWRPDTDEVTVSREFRRIHGLGADEPVTLERIGSCFHPDDVAVLTEKVAEARRGRGNLDYEVRLRMPDGSIKHLHTVSQSIRGPDNQLEIVGAVQDITERKRAEAELRRSTAYLAEAQMLSLTGSFTWNVSTDEHFWSDEVYRLFEYDLSTRVSMQMILQSIHPEDTPLVDDVIARASLGQDFEIEFRAVMRSGAVKHLRVVAHRMRDRSDAREYIGAIQDITERRVSEEALGKARSELARMARVTSLGALTASIAHEVNQPLSGIITNANTCLKMLAADPPNVLGAQETARRTVRDGNRAADVIRRLRVLFAGQGATSEPVDLNEAAREVIALSWSDLQRSRVIVRSEFADDLPPVAGDRVQLQQVILNLLLNAADAMSGVEERPRLATIATDREEGDRVRLTVRDAGVGLDSQTTARLFDAFFTTKSEGMGIGLSISRTIIDNHGGRLWAESNDGPGARFAFSVPCAPGAASAAGVTRAEPQPGKPQDIMVKR